MAIHRLANDVLTPAAVDKIMAGADAQKRGRDFENLVAKSFDAYAAIGKCWLEVMPTPTVPTRFHDISGAPLCRMVGKPPFDFYGYWIETGLMIGAELKAISKRDSSLSIVPAGHHWSGLQYHQLEALANLARAGGTAKIVWDNGGEWMVLNGDQIVVAHEVYLTAVAAERAGKRAQIGSKSISSKGFHEIRADAVGGMLCVDWLELATTAHPP